MPHRLDLCRLPQVSYRRAGAAAEKESSGGLARWARLGGCDGGSSAPWTGVLGARVGALTFQHRGQRSGCSAALPAAEEMPGQGWRPNFLSEIQVLEKVLIELA